MILTIYSVKNSTFSAVGSEFTGEWGGKDALFGSDQSVVRLSSRPAFATFLMGKSLPLPEPHLRLNTCNTGIAQPKGNTAQTPRKTRSRKAPQRGEYYTLMQ